MVIFSNIKKFLIKYGEMVNNEIKKINNNFLIGTLKKINKYKRLKRRIILNSALKRISKPDTNAKIIIEDKFCFFTIWKKK